MNKVASLLGIKQKETGPSQALLASQQKQENRIEEQERKERRELQARQNVQAGVNLKGGTPTGNFGFRGLADTLGGA